MKNLVTTFLFLALVGCATGQGGMFGPGKFEVIQADSRFSSTNNVIYTSLNNRISSKSIAGGIHIDGSGVFVNPVLTKSPDQSKVLYLGLHIDNMTSYDSTYGAPNRLGSIETITFLIDNGKPLILEVNNNKNEWSDVVSYNSATHSASSQIIESGVAMLSLEEYSSIISARTLAVKIRGSKRSIVYETKDISKGFVANLKQFYDFYVLKSPA